MPLRAKCTKCSGEMAEGFIPELGLFSQPYAVWVSGRPQRNLLGGAKTAEADVRRIQVYRCISCGYLEAYASESS